MRYPEKTILELHSVSQCRISPSRGTNTSKTAPAVAELIATYMGYNEPPPAPGPTDDVEDVERVEAIIKYIQSDMSSYKRNGNETYDPEWGH